MRRDEITIQYPVDFVIFPFPGRWSQWEKEGFRTRAAHWLLNLANDSRVRKVILVDQPEMSYLNKTTIRNESEKIVVVERKSVISRKILPFQRINIKIWKELNLDPKKTIVLIGNPIEMENAINVPHSKLIFDCVDNLSIHPQYQYFHYKKKIDKGYKLVEQHADIIVVVNPSLKNKFPKKQVVPIRNAVSTQFLQNIEKYHIELNGHAICYFGIVQDRVNLELLSKVREVVGIPVQVWGKIWGQNPEIIKKKYKNLDFMGEYHYSDLPKLMNNAKIFVIPHYVNDFSNSMDPLKLYEYLSTGKPVVSSNINSVYGLDELVEIATDDESFIEGIKRALNEDNVDLVEKRKQFAKLNSWENRVNELFNLINNDI
ncbi:hypothetical protein HW35_08815 [Bacillus sp. X1(2014)]|nr:hypothetical protein HW35_08815 [Bacillus sp. X1(2014)]